MEEGRDEEDKKKRRKKGGEGQTYCSKNHFLAASILTSRDAGSPTAMFWENDSPEIYSRGSLWTIVGFIQRRTTRSTWVSSSTEYKHMSVQQGVGSELGSLVRRNVTLPACSNSPSKLNKMCPLISISIQQENTPKNKMLLVGLIQKFSKGDPTENLCSPTLGYRPPRFTAGYLQNYPEPGYLGSAPSSA